MSSACSAPAGAPERDGLPPERRARPLPVVANQAERVPCGIEADPNVGAWLLTRERRPERECLLDGIVEIADLDIEVQHRTLLSLDGGPVRRTVAGGVLEHDEHRTARRNGGTGPPPTGSRRGETGEQITQLLRSAEHRPVTRLDVDVADVARSSQLGHLTAFHPTSRAIR